MVMSSMRSTGTCRGVCRLKWVLSSYVVAILFVCHTITWLQTAFDDSSQLSYYPRITANIHTDESSINPNSDYAYVFLIGDVHPTRIAYKGFLYNTLLAIRFVYFADTARPLT